MVYAIKMPDPSHGSISRCDFKFQDLNVLGVTHYDNDFVDESTSYCGTNDFPIPLMES